MDCDMVNARPCRHAPTYCPKLRELCIDGKLLYCFAPQAGNEHDVLKAFHDAGWPRQILNPLPEGRPLPGAESSPNRGKKPQPGSHEERGYAKRLSDTARALNLALEAKFIRFSTAIVDGQHTIRWDFVDRPRKRKPRGRSRGR